MSLKGEEVHSLAKFILSVGDGTFKILTSEAKKRDVTVQQLLRAVIVPEWVRESTELSQHSFSASLREIAPHLMHESLSPSQRDLFTQTPVNRLRG